MSTVYIYGAGGHGVVVAEIAETLGHSVAGFIDDDEGIAGSDVIGWRVLGGKAFIAGGGMVALGVGGNLVRARLLAEARQAEWTLATLVHPSAVISKSAELGDGTVVVAQAAVNARTRIGGGCILNTGCSVDHDCLVAESAHIAPGARIAAGCEIGECSLIGIGACIRPNVKIGSHCVIGAGSVVVCDIPDRATAYGNPARVRTAVRLREGGFPAR